MYLFKTSIWCLILFFPISGLALKASPYDPNYFLNTGNDNSKLRDQWIDHIYIQTSRQNELAKQNWEGPSQTLTTLTFNLGFLDYWYLQSPEYDLRTDPQIIEKVLFYFLVGRSNDKPTDVVFLQELWHEKDFDLISRLARLYGYVPVFENYYEGFHNGGSYKDGLQILIRKDRFQALVPVNRGKPPLTQEWFESLPGIGINRRLAYAHVTLNDGTPILLATTHLTPLMMGYLARMCSVQTIAEFLRGNVQKNGYVLFGGDFNASPSVENPLDGDDANWDKNRNVYIYFYHLAHLTDSYIAATAKKQDGFTPIDSGPTWVQSSPLIDHKDSSASTRHEPTQRVDISYFGVPRKDENTKTLPYYVSSSRVVLAQNVTPFEKPVFPQSDHRGVYSVIVIPLTKREARTAATIRAR